MRLHLRMRLRLRLSLLRLLRLLRLLHLLLLRLRLQMRLRVHPIIYRRSWRLRDAPFPMESSRTKSIRITRS